MHDLQQCRTCRPRRGSRPGLRERKRQRTRETIARVALELFDRQGFQETTIPQIAEAADVSPRTVSAYFPHKEDLAFPDAEEEFDAFDARLRERLPGETAMEALRAFIRATVEEAGGARERAPCAPRVIHADDGLRAHEHRYMRAGAGDHRRRDRPRPRRLRRRPRAADGRRGDADRLRPARRGLRTADPAEVLAVMDRALLFIGGGISALR